MRLFRRLWQAAVALVLVGILAGLYQASEPGELRHQGQVQLHLRQLREVDAAWNRALDLGHGDAEAVRPLYPLIPLFQSLADATAAVGDAGLEAGLQALRGAFLDKQRLMGDLTAQGAALAAAQAAAREGAAALRQWAEGAGRHEVDLLAEQLALSLTRMQGGSDEPARVALRQAMDALGRQAPQQAPDTVARIAALGARVQAIIDAAEAIQARSADIARLPTLPRVKSLADAYDRRFEAIAGDKERYRVYLVFYSAALLVLVGYVLWQLNRRNREIEAANAALSRVNETLEHRVEERTRELTEALRHLKDSEAMLVQTEKLSSLGQMVAGIAHEINTPLAYVKSSLETLRACWPAVSTVFDQSDRLLALLATGEASDEALAAQFAAVRAALDHVRDAHVPQQAPQLASDGLHGVDQIGEIIASLKNFSRLDRNKLAAYNLNEGLESTLVIARSLVKHRQVRKRLGEIPAIECSPSQINQVFLNLITNATQATAEGSGVITLATQLLPGAAEVRVDVMDNGHGIPESVLPRIFDPFFTTKDVGEGTGLGLSIAYKIVQEHGGRIEVKSKPGTGTLFSVFLPVQSRHGQAPA